MPQTMKNGLFLLDAAAMDLIYGPAEREDISRLVRVYSPPQTRQSIAANPAVLAEAEVIFSGWGMAVMDEAFLAAAPRLEAVFYGAGSIQYCVTDAFWRRKIAITSAYAANAVPVAEYTLSQILFGLKCGWHFALSARGQGRLAARKPVPGAYGSTVGLVSLGMVGRAVAGLLRHFDVKVLAYDPFVPAEQGRALGVEMVGLAELFSRSDVVSLHTPWRKETEGLITGELIASMKPGATLINTARGAIIRENEMTDVLGKRSDLYAVLDVTHPEPPLPGSPLYTLPNVILTPHIAGSMDNECRRMGRYMVEELQRYLAGERLTWGISKEQAARLA